MKAILTEVLKHDDAMLRQLIAQLVLHLADEEQQRQEFEIVFTHAYDLERGPLGHYINLRTENAWAAWKLART